MTKKMNKKEAAYEEEQELICADGFGSISEEYGETEEDHRREYGNADEVKAYYREIAGYPLLSAAEEAELTRRAHAGDAKARERMICSNLRLVASVAKKYMYCGLSFQDLCQEGVFGLMTAIDKFDPDRGLRFSTYGTIRIREAIHRAVQDDGRTVRLPVHVQEKLHGLKETHRMLTQELKREPTLRELSKAAGLSERKITEFYMAGYDMRSLDESVGEDGDEEFSDMIADETVVSFESRLETEELHRALRVLLGKMPERYMQVIVKRFGLNGQEPKNLEEIGKEFGLSKERIRQIEVKAMAYLRMPSNVRFLKEYLA